MSRVLRNTGWLLLSLFFGKVLSLAWNLYLARYFNSAPEQYGYYMLLLSQYAVLGILAEGNVRYGVQQFIAEGMNEEERERKKEEAWPFIIGARVITGGTAGFIYFLLMALKYPFLAGPSFILGVTLLGYVVGSAPLGIFGGREEFRPDARSSMIHTGVFVGSAFLMTWFTSHLVFLALCSLLATVASSGYIWRKALKSFGRPRGIPGSLRTHGGRFFKFCAPRLGSSVLFMFFYRGDILVITDELGPESAGVYNIALMLFFLFIDVTWSQFGAAFTPSLISRWSGDRHTAENRRLIREILKSYTVVGIVALFGLLLLGRPLMTLFFGRGGIWVAAADPLFGLAVGFTAVVGYSLLYRLVLLERGPNYYLGVSLVVVGLKFIIVRTWAPHWGLTGIALFTSFAMILFYGALLLGVSRETRGIFLERKLLLSMILPVCLIAGLRLIQGMVTEEIGSYSWAALGIVGLWGVMVNLNGLRAVWARVFPEPMRAKT